LYYLYYIIYIIIVTRWKRVNIYHSHGAILYNIRFGKKSVLADILYIIVYYTYIIIVIFRRARTHTPLAQQTTTRIGDSHSMFTSCYTRCCNKAIYGAQCIRTTVILYRRRIHYIIVTSLSLVATWEHPHARAVSDRLGGQRIFFVVVVVVGAEYLHQTACV